MGLRKDAGPSSRRPDPAGDMDAIRTLFLMRHAQSRWADATLGDLDRPLAPRGRRAGRRIADHLRAQAVRPQLVLCSSARRARATLAELTPVLGDQVEIVVTDDLYGANADEMLGQLRELVETPPQ